MKQKMQGVFRPRLYLGDEVAGGEEQGGGGTDELGGAGHDGAQDRQVRQAVGGDHRAGVRSLTGQPCE